MFSQSITASVVIVVCCIATVSSLTIKRFETTLKPSTTTTTTPPTTTVSPNGPVEQPQADGPIVVLQHHGTLDGPSGRFEKTEFENSPPVDLSLPPVFLPEFTPIFEDTMEMKMSASYDQPQFARTENSAAPPVDLGRPVIFLPEATPIYEPPQERNAAQQAILFVRG